METSQLEICEPDSLDTNDLANKKVWIGRASKKNPDALKKVGRIHAFVFHPSRPQLVGFLVKRPDVALMFRRQDEFVAHNGFDIIDGDIVVHDDSKAVGRAALKDLQVNLDHCILWFGLPVMCEDGTDFGIADSVTFDPATGRVITLTVSQGSTANTLLGKRTVPGNLIRGFKRGMGAKLWLTDDDDDNPNALGALLVADAVKDIDVTGGIAEKAGEATAIATDKVKRTYKKVVKKVKPQAEEAKEAAGKAAGKAAAVAGEAIKKGAYVTGRQIARTEGMFSRFKEEFDKALHDDDISSTMK